MHIRFNFNEVMLGRAKYAYQFDSGAFQSSIVLTVGQGHFTPVDNTLNQNALVTGMNQMGNKIGVINTINTDFDGT